MFAVFNMGIGLCVIVGEADADRVCEIARGHGSDAHLIGRAVAADEKSVRLPQFGLCGTGTSFGSVE